MLVFTDTITAVCLLLWGKIMKSGRLDWLLHLSSWNMLLRLFWSQLRITLQPSSYNEKYMLITTKQDYQRWWIMELIIQYLLNLSYHWEERRCTSYFSCWNHKKQPKSRRTWLDGKRWQKESWGGGRSCWLYCQKTEQWVVVLSLLSFFSLLRTLACGILLPTFEVSFLFCWIFLEAPS